MNTRKPKEGPDGIQLWNRIFKRVKDQESAIALCKTLIDRKLDSLDAIDDIIEKWQVCYRLNGGIMEDVMQDFGQHMDMMRNEKARKTAQELAKRKSERSRKGNAE